MILDPNEVNSTSVYGLDPLVSIDDVLDFVEWYEAVSVMEYPIQRISRIWHNAREVAHMRMTGSLGDER